MHFAQLLNSTPELTCNYDVVQVTSHHQKKKTGLSNCLFFVTNSINVGKQHKHHCMSLLSLCHLFLLNDVLHSICGFFLTLHFLFLARCPSMYPAVSSDIPTVYNERKGSEWVSMQTHTLRNNQQTCCTLTTFESCYQIKHKGREQNCFRTVMLQSFSGDNLLTH